MAQASRWESLDDVITDRTKRPLEVLREVAKYQRYLSAIERGTVQAARAEGRTWDEIGAASGVTRQASWKRWGRQPRADWNHSTLERRPTSVRPARPLRCPPGVG